jgi:Phospholipase_D-nuclease N-terminal
VLVAHTVVEATNFLPLGPFLVFALVGLVMFVIWIVALVDALRIPDRDWDRAGQSKLLWVLVIALLGAIGAVLYFAMARPTLRRH